MFNSKRKTLQMNKLLVTPLTASAKEQQQKNTLKTKTGIELVFKSQLAWTSYLHRKGTG